MVSPMIAEIKKNMKGKVDETAAKAWCPSVLPTQTALIRLKVACRRFARSIGMENLIS